MITGLPRQDIAAHYSCRQALTAIREDPGSVERAHAGGDLLAIIDHITRSGVANLFGVTGSFLVGCFTAHSDIDLVCYGTAGYQAAQELFKRTDLIRPYAGGDLTRLYLRRAKYMAGSDFDNLIKQEQRKLQGLTTRADAHVNCEPIRSDDDRTFARTYAKEIGEMTLLATVTDHTQGLATPALYQIKVQNILSSTVDELGIFTRRITHMRSYLGAYTGAFRAGDTVYITGKLIFFSKRCIRSCMPAVVRPCCCTPCCTELTLTVILQ